MPPEAAALVDRVHRGLLAAGNVPAADAALREAVEGLARAEAPLLDAAGLVPVVAGVCARVRGLGPLERLLADPEVSEVMVNGPGKLFVERHGRLERVPTDLDGPAITHLIERVVGPLGLRIDRSSPLVDARLPDGSRVNAVVPPLAVDGPCLTIRRFGARAIALAELCPSGVAELLGWAVRARANLLVSGGTGAGKTTLLNALAAEIPAGERVVTVEDTAELRLPGDHVVRLEARPPNAEGAGEVRLHDLVRNSLRMRPDRIVVGEVRGPEALDMLWAMNSGHEGSLSTCHANGPADALRRLEAMVLAGDSGASRATGLPFEAVREQVDAAVDLVVHVARRPGGARAVVEVAELVPAERRTAGAPGRLRRLAGPDGLEALPWAPPRLANAAPADPAWLRAGSPS